MILTMDAGNTNVLLGCWADKKLVYTARMYTAQWRTAEEWAVLLRDILSSGGVDISLIEGAALSCVASPITSALANAIQRAFGCVPIVVGPGVKTGLDIQIDNPAQLGSDMVCNAVAALRLYEPPLIIFDMGTATSISVLDPRGRFLGGALVPGVRTALEALSSKAAQLPNISLDTPERVIGRNTIECMQSGSLFSTAAMVEGMTARIEEELGAACTVLITGGISEAIAPHIRREAVHNPSLLLEGLRMIYEKNAK